MLWLLTVRPRQVRENQRDRRGRNKTDMLCLTGECLTRTSLGLENTYGQVREIDAQLVSRAGFLIEE